MAIILPGDMVIGSSGSKISLHTTSISGERRSLIPKTAYSADFNVGDGVVISPSNDKVYFTSSSTPTVRKFDVASETFDTAPTNLPVGAIYSMAINSDGSEICVTSAGSAGANRFIRYGTSDMSKLTDPSVWPTGLSRKPGYSPNGTWLAIPHETSPYITIYELATMNKIADPAILPTGTMVGANFSPDSSMLAIVGGSGAGSALVVYNTSSWSKITIASVPSHGSYYVEWNPDGSKLAVLDILSLNYTVYETSGWTKLTNPTLPSYVAGVGRGISWINNDIFILTSWTNSSGQSGTFCTINIQKTFVINVQDNNLVSIGNFATTIANNGSLRKLSGTVVNANSPADPLERKIRIYDKNSGLFVSKTESYEDGLFEAIVYTSDPCYAVAIGEEGPPFENSKIKDRLVPVTVTEDIEFVAASGTTYVTATTQDQTIPASADVNDLILAFIVHRSALTAPSGWTLVDSAEVTVSGTTQYTSVYKRIASSGDAGLAQTWTQASSGVLAVHYNVYRNSTGCDVLQSTDVVNTTTVSTNVPALNAESVNQMGVFACSWITAASGMTATFGRLTTPASVTNNRLGVANRPFFGEKTLSGAITSAASTAGSAGVYVIIG